MSQRADTVSAAELSRREFLAVAGGAVAAGAVLPAAAKAAAQEPVAFVLVGDTHYFAQQAAPGKLDEVSAAVNARLIDRINELAGRPITPEAGSGQVARLRGVIHAGDLIDTGDKNGAVQAQMQTTEWQHFVADYGLSGSEGRLKLPVYEIHGNHDGPRGSGLVIDGIKERNQKRPGLKHVSPSGLHYSWDWGEVHFVNLGIVVGQDQEGTQRRRYSPLGSLEFLKDDLRKQVGESGRPVVITHHVDVQRYSVHCDPADPANLNKEWHPCDAQAFHKAVQGYNVAAILYGHTHARNILKWNGTATRTATGLDLFNVDNSAHFHSDKQALFYFEITERELIARELATADRWQTADWTPQVWKRPLAAG